MNGPFRHSSRLPADFQGVDIKRLIRSLASTSSLKGKSEFESTESYDARLSLYPAVPAPFDLTYGDLIAIVLGRSRTGDGPDIFFMTYDADDEEFRFRTQFTEKRMFLTHGAPILAETDLQSDIISSEQYVGTTAMGASTQVSDIFSETFGVAIDPHSWLFAGASPSPVPVASFSIKVPRTVAAELKPNLRVALIATLRKPWLANDTFGAEATLKSPTKVLEQKSYLVIDARELLFFRADTGEILEKVNETGIEPMQAPLSSPQDAHSQDDRSSTPQSVAGRGDLISGLEPVYPSIARAAHVSGVVLLDVLIDASGSVTDMKVTSGSVFLRDAALDAVRTWKYKPLVVNGVPTAYRRTVTVNFAFGP